MADKSGITHTDESKNKFGHLGKRCLSEKKFRKKFGAEACMACYMSKLKGGRRYSVCPHFKDGAGDPKHSAFTSVAHIFAPNYQADKAELFRQQ